MRTGFSFITVANALTLPIFFFCVPLSTEPTDNEPTLLRLSLEEQGRTVAEFSGAPIEAIIELDRDTIFDSLRWRTGQGDPPDYSRDLIGKTEKRFSVRLYWTKYPLVKDSADSCFWDTVWVSMGGGLKKSNKVRIKVVNLPVVFDSARFNTMIFLGQDTVWRCSLPAILEDEYPLQIYARDLDRKPLALKVFGVRGAIDRADLSSLTMSYKPPQGDFVDTVIFIASDQMLGSATRTLVIKHRTPNILPYIDSIRIGREMLAASSMAGGMYRVGFVAFDTLQMTLFVHDSSGTITTARWSSRRNTLTPDAANPLHATYICAAKECGDTLRDSSAAVDTIRIAVFDDRGDSTVRLIELSRGAINRPPEILSLSLDGSLLAPTDTVVTSPVTGGVSHLLQLSASDPEKKKLLISWTGYPSSRFSEKTDSTIRYTAPAVHDTDTVRVMVSDGAVSISRTIRMTIDDIVPIFDSIVAGDTVFKNDDTVFALTVAPRDTLLLLASARDRDAADSMTFLWAAGKSARFTVRLGNRARYVLPDSSLNDTIIIKLQDGAYESARKIIIRPVNLPPVVDSLRAGDIRLIQSGAFFRDTATTGDTIDFRFYARDPEGDTLSYQWGAHDSASFIVRLGGNARYLCGDTAYVDTVSVQASDPAGSAAVRRIIVKVDTPATP